jgi:hypothetical protein
MRLLNNIFIILQPKKDEIPSATGGGDFYFRLFAFVHRTSVCACLAIVAGHGSATFMHRATIHASFAIITSIFHIF